MEDNADIFEAMNQEKKERHAKWHEVNTIALKESGLSFRIASRESYLFRDAGAPKADFYPSTGRWRDVGTGKTYRGGAKSFIAWYINQKIKKA